MLKSQADEETDTNEASLEKTIMETTRALPPGCNVLIKTGHIRQLASEYCQRPIMPHMITQLTAEIIKNPYKEIPAVSVVDLLRSQDDLNHMTNSELADLTDWRTFGGQHSVM
jgi:hypothetical protein